MPFSIKIMVWRGNIEIGVTTCDPETTKLPSAATNLRHGTWIMSGSSIVHDGTTILELYGSDLSNLEEGHTLGVCRTSKVHKIIFICIDLINYIFYKFNHWF